LSSNSEFVTVGRVKDAHGLKGELFITLFAGEAAWLGQLKELRLISEAKSPGVEQTLIKTLKIKSVRLHKNGLIAKTDELQDRNEAESLKGWLMEISSQLLVSKPGEMIYLREIQGFRVFTEVKGEVGIVHDFASNGAQDLLVVKTGWGDFEIPFIEAFVKSIDFKAREIRLDIPEGLLGEE
jgi:16S rRNA processing protein RimM